MDQLNQLEQKLLKVIEQYRKLQEENRSLAMQLEKARNESQQSGSRQLAVEKEVETLRLEREKIRDRVERLLLQVDALTKADSAG
jgi:uncharacterized coiled-coil DUF342 family protein